MATVMEPMETLFENTTMYRRVDDTTNVLKGYRIYPIEGYVLHSTGYDVEVFDEETMEPTGEILPGFIPYPAFVQVGYNYDFEANPMQFYAVPQDSVPADQIFNNGSNDHEVASTENTETE